MRRWQHVLMLPLALMRILVVDDDPALRRALMQALAQLGFRDLREAADGIDALEAMEEFRPQLLLTDCQMPRMDGIRLTRALRAGGVTIPILMISAVTDRQVIRAALNAGVSQFLSKPTTIDDLAAAIAQAQDAVTSAA